MKYLQSQLKNFYARLKKCQIKNKAVFLGVFIFTVVYCSPAIAQTISSSPAPITVERNKNFSFTLSIGPVNNLFGVGFQMIYNSALLKYQGATKENFLSKGCSVSFLKAENPVGTVNVSLNRLGADCGTVSGPGDLVTFNFQSLGNDGSTAITFTDTILSIVENGQLIEPFPTGTWNPVNITILESSATAPAITPAPAPTPAPDIPATDALPPVPTDINATSSDKQITLAWKNPDGPNFKGVLIVRKVGGKPINKEDGKIVYQGAAEKYTDTGLDNNITYHYGFFAYASDTYWPVSAISVRPLAGKKPAKNVIAAVVDCPENLGRLYGAAKEIVNCVAQRESLGIYGKNELAPLNNITRDIYERIIKGEKSNLADNVKNSIASFIHYGTPATKFLGEGERAGVINSYRAAFNKFPLSAADWQDVIKIANGRWPNEKNAQAEEKTKKEIFKKIYLREPDMSNASDNAAVTVITYGLRPVKRNTESEKSGITIFNAIYGRAPQGASDWDIVRAIAYSGAKR